MAYVGYLVRGKFRVYNGDGTLVRSEEDPLFLNKFFDVEFPAAVQKKALKHMATRVRKNYGKRATFEQISDLTLIQKERKTKLGLKRDCRQLNFFD